jgi:hypothetical protein
MSMKNDLFFQQWVNQSGGLSREIYDPQSVYKELIQYDKEVLFGTKILWSGSHTYYMCVDVEGMGAYPLPLVFNTHEGREKSRLMAIKELWNNFYWGYVDSPRFHKELDKLSRPINHEVLDSLAVFIKDELTHMMWGDIAA